MDSPKTLFDRENRFNSRFFFISYAHRDKDAVYQVLNELYDRDVNYWYDVELDPGDKWNERVLDIISDPLCVGAIVFLSESALLSEAVEQEIQRLKERAGSSKEFKIIAVIMGYPSAQELILSAGSNAGIYKRLGSYWELTLDDIWITYDEAVEKLANKAKKANVIASNSIYLRDSLLDSVSEFVQGGGTRNYLFGKYPFDCTRKEKKIEWTLVQAEDSKLFFVSKYCLDFLGESEISAFLETMKCRLNEQFNELLEEAPHGNDSGMRIESIAPLSETFLERYREKIGNTLPTDYADLHREQALRAFWVSEGDGASQKYCLYNSMNRRLKEQISYQNINAGLRLLLIIQDNKIGRNNL